MLHTTVGENDPDKEAAPQLVVVKSRAHVATCQRQRPRSETRCRPPLHVSQEIASSRCLTEHEQEYF